MPSPFNSPPPSQNSTSSSVYKSPQMRKEALRNVYVNAQALENDVNTKTVENLDQIISEVDIINKEGTLEEKIQDQAEVILDSEIMTISSNVLKKCSISLSKDISCYDSNEFADKIKSYVARIPDTVNMTDDRLNWYVFGKEIMKFFKRTASFEMILGTLQPIPKKEVVRRKIVREAQAPTKRPEKVIVVEKEEDSIEQTVMEIRKIISNYQKQYKKPLDFFQLVLHPTSFGKTIENILHVSFLVRDGFIQIFEDEEGIPQVRKSTKDEVEAVKNPKLSRKKKNVQNVLFLNMQEWSDLVQAYSIRSPMIDMKTNTSSKTK